MSWNSSQYNFLLTVILNVLVFLVPLSRLFQRFMTYGMNGDRYNDKRHFETAPSIVISVSNSVVGNIMNKRISHTDKTWCAHGSCYTLCITFFKFPSNG